MLRSPSASGPFLKITLAYPRDRRGGTDKKSWADLTRHRIESSIANVASGGRPALRKKRAIPGPAAAATIEELLSKDRRAAVQIILEERTGEHDAEDRDGNLPDLEQPTSRGSVGP